MTTAAWILTIIIAYALGRSDGAASALLASSAQRNAELETLRASKGQK